MCEKLWRDGEAAVFDIPECAIMYVNGTTVFVDLHSRQIVVLCAWIFIQTIHIWLLWVTMMVSEHLTNKQTKKCCNKPCDYPDCWTFGKWPRLSRIQIIKHINIEDIETGVWLLWCEPVCYCWLIYFVSFWLFRKCCCIQRKW